MAYNFLPHSPDQVYLLPPSLQEWVGEGSLARWVSDTVEEFDREQKLQGFYAGYREDGWGRAGYPRGCWSRCCSTPIAAG
jgi:hypothetical protein